MTEVAARNVTALQRCVTRARTLLAEAGATFRDNQTLQDAAVLNVIRACDTTIDLANMVIRRKRLGIPGESRESFAILAREGIIATESAARLQKMVGFRDVAVHQYQDLDLHIVESVIRTDLDEVLAFAQTVRPHLAATRDSC